MLGGGIFVTQNKVLPGAYINVISASKATSTVADRGVVAIALPLEKSAGSVIELNRADFQSRCKELTGKAYESADVLPLREIFKNAVKCYVYDLGSEGTVAEAMTALESYNFNVVCAYTSNSEDVTAYIDKVKSWRDDLGKKCQVVVYNGTTPNSEAVINVKSTLASGSPDYALVAWVAGAEAGCKINESITNKLYNGELNINVKKTQSELEAHLTAGEFVFNLVYGDVRVLEDINSLTDVTVDKGEDFKSNQTIRVIDQIANDIAKLFNTKYLGKVPNNASGRVSLWADIVAHHRKLEELNAIQDFDSSLLRVEQGEKKKAVVVYDTVNVVNAMAQLYMTLVIQ